MIRRLPTSDQSFVVCDTALTDHKPHIYFEGTDTQTRQLGCAKLYNSHTSFNRGATPTREAGGILIPCFRLAHRGACPPALSSTVYTPLIFVESRLSHDVLVVLLVPSGSCRQLQAVDETSQQRNRGCLALQ